MKPSNGRVSIEVWRTWQIWYTSMLLIKCMITESACLILLLFETFKSIWVNIQWNNSFHRYAKSEEAVLNLHTLLKREMIAGPTEICSVYKGTHIVFRCIFTGLMCCVQAVFLRIFQSWIRVRLFFWVDSGSWQHALPNMNDFLCCGPGLWYLSAPHPSLLCLALHLFSNVSAAMSPCAVLPISPSFCPLAHSPPWLEHESRNVSLDLLIIVSAWALGDLPPSSFSFPSALPWHCHPHTSSCGSLWSPCCPSGPNSGCPW